MPRVKIAEFDVDVDFDDAMSPEEITAAIERDVLPELRRRKAEDPVPTNLLNRNKVSGEEIKRRAAAGKDIIQDGEGLRYGTDAEQMGRMATDFAHGVARGVGGLSVAADVAAMPVKTLAATLKAAITGSVDPLKKQAVAMSKPVISDTVEKVIDRGAQSVKDAAGVGDVELGPGGEVVKFVGDVVAPGPEAAVGFGAAKGVSRHLAEEFAAGKSDDALAKFFDGALTPGQEERKAAGLPFELTPVQRERAMENVRKLADEKLGVEESGTPITPEQRAIDSRRYADQMDRAGVKLEPHQIQDVRKGKTPVLTDDQKSLVQQARIQRNVERTKPESLDAFAPIERGMNSAVGAVVDTFGKPIARVMDQSSAEPIQQARKNLFAAHREHSQAMGQVRPFLKKMQMMPEKDQAAVMELLDDWSDDSLADARRRSPEVAQMAVVMRSFLKDVGKKAERAHLVGEGLDGNTHLFRAKEVYAPRVGTISDTAEPPTVMAIRDGITKMPGATSGSVNARVGGKLIQRAEDLTKYFDKMYREVAEKKHFGKLTQDGKLLAQDEQIAAGINMIKQSAARAGATANEIEFTEMALKHVLGGGDQELSRTSKFLGKLATTASLIHLPYSAINNFAQIANTFKAFTPENVFGSILRTGDTYSREVALMSGGPTQTMIRDVMGPATGKLEQALSWMLNHNGFTTAEKINRTVTTLSGMRWADEMASQVVAGGKKAAIAAEELQKLGINTDDVIRNRGLTRQMREDVGFHFSERLQHGTRPEDMPLGWVRSPIGRAATLFMGYPLKQMYFVLDELFKPLIKAQAHPDSRASLQATADIAKYVAVGVPLYMLADMGNDVIRARDPRDRVPEERVGRLMTSLAGTGILTDQLRSFVGRGHSSVILDDAYAIGKVVGDVAQKDAADVAGEIKDGTSPVNDLIAKFPPAATVQNLTTAGQTREAGIRETNEERRESLRDLIHSRLGVH